MQNIVVTGTASGSRHLHTLCAPGRKRTDGHARIRSVAPTLPRSPAKRQCWNDGLFRVESRRDRNDKSFKAKKWPAQVSR
jgi:hypothetical protein